MGNKTKGLYRKFTVRRSDDPASLGKHRDCDYFVLDMTHDAFAKAAIAAYADACAIEYPLLAQDLRSKYLADAVPTDGRSPNDGGYREVTLEDAFNIKGVADGVPCLQSEAEDMLTALRTYGAVIRCPAGEVGS